MARGQGRVLPNLGPSYQSISPSPTSPATKASNTARTADQDAIDEEAECQRSAERRFLSQHADEPQNFTLRGILVGLGVGLIVCFSNMYFGLQTGWISVMSMPSALIGFAFFKSLQRHLDIPFTPVENVLVQTVAGAMGTMPLGCGFVGVMPALNYLLKDEEGGPLFLSLWKMITWALGLCFFGVVFAVPLRRQVIIREKLKFPSGTATALMISVLHGQNDLEENVKTREHEEEGGRSSFVADSSFSGASLSSPRPSGVERRPCTASCLSEEEEDEEAKKWATGSWRHRVQLLIIAFGVSGLYTFATYFIPVLRDLPIFGGYLATNWLWTLNPSPAYVGQGIIMGPATTMHMLLGAVLGWAILSPLAKNQGWAPGPVKDWENGSKGWIIWVSLAIMLADSIISLGYIAFKPVVSYVQRFLQMLLEKRGVGNWKDLLILRSADYVPLSNRDSTDLSNVATSSSVRSLHAMDHTVSSALRDLPDVDAPPEHLVSARTVWVGLTTSVLFCVFCIHFTFGTLIPIYLTATAVFLALVLSIMGVRALGETDLNPVSGISKLAQLLIALVTPAGKNAVLINLIAGAVSEAGALQAGDLMQDLKTGHLLGAAPNAQFYGQLIGSAIGAVVSACIYRLYTSVYTVPGDLFQVPTGFVWVFTARLVTGKGLPDGVVQWAIGAALIFTVTTVVRIWARTKGKWWRELVPGGIAVAVGMYNIPSFTLARAIGGLMNWYWKVYLGKQETPLVVVASGLVLGEGVLSILSLVMASMNVSHL